MTRVLRCFSFCSPSNWRWLSGPKGAKWHGGFLSPESREEWGGDPAKEQHQATPGYSVTRALVPRHGLARLGQGRQQTPVLLATPQVLSWSQLETGDGRSKTGQTPG